MDYKNGFFCGRLQHIHIGHESVISQALESCENLLILVGSSQESGTVRNPFSIETRISLIKDIYGDRVLVSPLTDMTDETDINTDWGRFVLKHAREGLQAEPEVMFYGNDEDRKGWFDPDDVSSIKEVIIDRNVIPVSATEQREAMTLKDFWSWAKYVNKAIRPKFHDLRTELLEVPFYQQLLEEKGTWQKQK
ncbi:Bifunctional NMN adenylyltransferase/Nudix hydrolase [compost metagenome]